MGPVHTRKSLKVDQGIEKNLEADQKIGDLVEGQDQENISHEDIPPGQSQEKRKMIKKKNLKIRTRMKPSKRFLLEVECGFQLVRTVLLMESKRLSTKLKRKKEEDRGMGKGTDTGLGQEVTEEGLIAALVDTEEEAKEVGLRVVTGKEGARVEANQMQRKRKAEVRAK